MKYDGSSYSLSYLKPPIYFPGNSVVGEINLIIKYLESFSW